MAKLYFKYGTMNSGKSLEIIKVAHNYREQDKDVIVFTPGIDDRYSKGTVYSRVGVKTKAIEIYDDTDIFELTKQADNIHCVLVDEAQFLTKKNILDMTRIVDELHIPVMAFGLKNDFSNKLFEGSYYLLVYADKIEEIKTICWYCDNKATMNYRKGESTQTIEIGGNESYIPVCRSCFKKLTQAKAKKNALS